MDEFSCLFKTWMDERGLRPETLSPLIGKEAGTITQWRSRGVPTRESVRAHVTAFMARFDEEAKAEAERELSDVIHLEVDNETFDQWNRAALISGKIIREWARDGLDQLAKEDIRKYNFDQGGDLRVAEDGEEEKGGGDE